MVREILAVAIGGAAGSLARYALLLVFSLPGAAWLPVATLTANLIGCLAIGFVAQWSAQGVGRTLGAIGIRIGLLGGLTTFSSFALDSLRLWQSDRVAGTVGLIAAHVLLGLAAAAVGVWLARTMPA
ncbi:MAG: fluoride efflux transporter CrcB [Pirellulaceae bacterium]